MKQLCDLTTIAACAEFVGIDLNTISVSGLPADLQQFTLAMAHRAIICRALNKVGYEDQPDWLPDYDNDDEYKYYPWGSPGKDGAVASGFGFQDAGCNYTGTDASVGARLSLRSAELVEHMWEHFRQVLVDTMVVQPKTA
jgi:hypothetical protein